MITFTKEQLIASAHARIEFAEMMLAGELEPLKERTWSIELELARIALASLEAEPVAWRSLYYENHGLLTGSKNVLASWQKQGWKCEPLYAAPTAPVSVKIPPEKPHTDGPLADGWNACRAAMLNGGKS